MTILSTKKFKKIVLKNHCFPFFPRTDAMKQFSILRFYDTIEKMMEWFYDKIKNFKFRST